MKWRNILERLQKLTPEQLEDDATIYIDEDDEYHKIKTSFVVAQDDVLHKGHFCLER